MNFDNSHNNNNKLFPNLVTEIFIKTYKYKSESYEKTSFCQHAPFSGVSVSSKHSTKISDVKKILKEVEKFPVMIKSFRFRANSELLLSESL